MLLSNLWKCILKIKNILTAGLNKAVYGACDGESKKKKLNLDIWICQIRLL